MADSELELKTKSLKISLDAPDCSHDGSCSESETEYSEEEPKNVIIGMISQLKKGMDLHKVPFPTFVLEPRSMLERITDFVSHPQLIIKYISIFLNYE